MVEGNIKTAVIYARVSTDDQAREGHSLEDQEKMAREFCRMRNYNIYKIYIEPGRSAKNDDRIEYQKMLKALKEKKANVVVAYKLDRLSRDTLDSEQLFRMAEEYKFDIDTIGEKTDLKNASGKLSTRVKAAVNQYIREETVEKTLIGVRSAARIGNIGGKPSLGYRKDVNNTDPNKRKNWIINEEEVPIVEKIFELCLNGYTYFHISNYMNKFYPKIRNWSDGSISRILNNKHYIGIHEYCKSVKDKPIEQIKGVIPRIISDEVFEQCQINVKRNKSNYDRNKHYLFMQKLKCPHCGRILACAGTKKENGVQYLYYRCKNCREYVQENWVEDAIKGELNKLLEFHLTILETHVPLCEDVMSESKIKEAKNKAYRYAIDKKIIEDRLNNCLINKNMNAWNNANYETKRKFIYDYIDNVEVKKKYDRKRRKGSVEIIKINFRENKINDFFFKFESNIITGYLEIEGGFVTIEKTKTQREVDEYVKELRKKYNIKVVQAENGGLAPDGPNLVKIFFQDNNDVVNKSKITLLYV